MPATVTRTQVLAFRVRVQQLDREAGALADTAVLDLGVQDTGPDGGLWALANRGVDVSALAGDELVTVWTLRGAPHLYLRAHLASVAAAVQPYSDADAGKRIFDAARPLKAAGIGNLEALDTVADVMRSLVDRPMAKGEVSTELTARVSPPYLRFCMPCNATHVYEQPFRLATLRAGLELQTRTSPPVLQPIPGFRRSEQASVRHDVIRTYLRLLGPATHRHVADYLDAPVKEVRARWPEDATEVAVDGEARWVLAADAERLAEAVPAAVRLLGPFDLFLQAKDRLLLVHDEARAKALWPALGRPGAVLAGGEVAGLWRPRKSGDRLRVLVTPWTHVSASLRHGVEEQAERLAVIRGARLAGIEFSD
ncbi:MAG: winged helix DNA-binding domain-containing protein [Actinomycetota bacterium]|nr:winged helix DNA-binding domain-containing protein [Actinomycetota bacterium]